MEKEKKRASKTSIIYWTIVAVCMALMVSMQFVFAAEEVTLWSRFKDIMEDFYLKLLGMIDNPYYWEIIENKKI